MLKVCYKNLFHLLIDRNIKKTDLVKMANLTPATLAKLSKDENISMDSLIRICDCLGCQIGDVVELVRE